MTKSVKKKTETTKIADRDPQDGSIYGINITTDADDIDINSDVKIEESARAGATHYNDEDDPVAQSITI